MKGSGVVALALVASCGSSPPPPARVAASPPAAAPPVAKPAEPPKPVIPETAAGKTMAAWLDAFNSGDAPRMKEFVARYAYPDGDEIVPFREETGGFDVI